MIFLLILRLLIAYFFLLGYANELCLRWWFDINMCYVFAVKHFRNLTCWVDEQGVYLSFELLDLLMCGG